LSTSLLISELPVVDLMSLALEWIACRIRNDLRFTYICTIGVGDPFWLHRPDPSPAADFNRKNLSASNRLVWLTCGR